MKIHLTGGKRYRDDRTGREYYFDWERFSGTVFEAGDQGRAIIKVKARLAEAAQISEEDVGSHLKDRRFSGAHFPAHIGIIRSYGAVLAGDEDAFLRPAVPAEWPTPEEMEALKLWEEQELAVLNNDLDEFGYESDARQVVLDVFAALWEILSLYRISDGYNRRPDAGGPEGAAEYFDVLLGDAREKSLYTRDMPGDTFDRLDDILRETERFVRGFLFPGVDLRWIGINPRLNYYDPVFDRLEAEPQPGASDRFRYSRFGYRPTRWDIRMRRLYFSGLEGQGHGAVMAYFQEELLDTLVKIFERDLILPVD